MTEDEAYRVLGTLVVETNGWDEPAIERTAERMMKWHDPLAAAEAIETVINTWTGVGRPPWATLLGEYRTAARRHAMSAPALNVAALGTLSNAEGRKVAARAYTRECRNRAPDDPHIRSGWRTREPNQRLLDGMLGLIGGDEDDDS